MANRVTNVSQFTQDFLGLKAGSGESWEPPQFCADQDGWSPWCHVTLAELLDHCRGLLTGLPPSSLTSLPRLSTLHPADEWPDHVIPLQKAREGPPAQHESQGPEPLRRHCRVGPCLCPPPSRNVRTAQSCQRCVCLNCALCWECPSAWASG